MGESGGHLCWCVMILPLSLSFSLLLSHRLKPLDIEFMKQLHHLVNIVPVIGKADTLTASELKKFKIKVREYICSFLHRLLCVPLSRVL